MLTPQHYDILISFGIRLLIDLFFLAILVRLYYRFNKSREFFLTFIIFNILILLICFLLNKIKMGIGAAFGLFAVFSMLRFRTEGASIKDMTYLFLVIAMGLISAVTKILDDNIYFNYIFLGGILLFLVSLTYLLESNILMKKELVKIINYEKFELLHASKSAELLEDVRLRTGINVHRISIQDFDFLRDSARIKIYYYE